MNFLNVHNCINAIGVFSTTAKYMKESVNKGLTLNCVIMFLLMISSENFAVPLNTPLNAKVLFTFWINYEIDMQYLSLAGKSIDIVHLKNNKSKRSSA